VVRTEAALGRERYGVRGTPTLTLADGTHLKLPIAFPRLENRRVVCISKLPCVGTGCDGAIRAFFERALDTRAAGAPQASPGAQPRNGRGST
jgi:hypothetical protein